MHLKLYRLLKLSAANNCLTLLANLSIQAKSGDPEQTAHIPHCLPLRPLMISADEKDDFCCD